MPELKKYKMFINGEWGKQMEVMLAEMTAQLKALGYIN